MTAPLVFLPGWCLGRGPLNAAIDALQGTIFDLPGYGDAPLITDFDAAVAAIAGRLQPGTTLAGWSLGAQLALAIAARAPEKIGKLLLVAGTASFVQRDGWPHAMARETLEAFAEGLRTEPAKTIRAFVNLNALGGPQARDRMRELAALLVERGAPSAESLAAGLALLHDADLRDEVATIDRPAAVIHGARDALAPAGAGRWLAGALPFARFVEIPDGAHLPFVSHTEAVARALEALHG